MKAIISLLILFLTCTCLPLHACLMKPADRTTVQKDDSKEVSNLNKQKVSQDTRQMTAKELRKWVRSEVKSLKSQARPMRYENRGPVFWFLVVFGILLALALLALVLKSIGWLIGLALLAGAIILIVWLIRNNG